MPGISRVGDAPGLLGLPARVAAKVASGEDQRRGLASAQLVDDALRCLLVSFASAAAHLVLVLIARPWANLRRQDDPRLSALFGGTPGAVADEIVPAARLVAETSDNRKGLECANLSEAFGWNLGTGPAYPAYGLPSLLDRQFPEPVQYGTAPVEHRTEVEKLVLSARRKPGYEPVN